MSTNNNLTNIKGDKTMITTFNILLSITLLFMMCILFNLINVFTTKHINNNTDIFGRFSSWIICIILWIVTFHFK